MHPSKKISGSSGNALSGRKVVLAVCGSVAAYRAPDVARALMRQGAEIVCVMSAGAVHFISADLMHWATGNAVVTAITAKAEHVELCGKTSGRADVLLIAPATSNAISEIAHGYDRGAVTLMAATALGSGVPVVIVPAMHEGLYDNPILRGNVKALEKAGAVFVPPRIGDDKAKLAQVDEIVDWVARAITLKSAAKPLRKKIVVTAGATREFVDGVRFISNPSTGAMGIEIAREAWRRGAEAIVVAGHLDVAVPTYLKVVKAESAQEMKDAVLREKADVYVLAGAPGDFEIGGKKMVKLDSAQRHSLVLSPLPKSADAVKKRWPKARLVIFKAEVSGAGLEGKARKRMKECGADFVVANVVGKARGFGTGNYEGTILGGCIRRKVSGTKQKAAAEILNAIF